jgi:hypothetical protein
VDWRREDSIYAAVTVVAGALVAFLIAGNFGLVPSPFGPVTASVASTPGQFTIRPARATSSSQTTAAPSTPGARTSVVPSFIDQTAPAAQVTTPGGARISATQRSRVTGVAGDANSGVDRVVVTFRPSSGEPVVVPATVTCDDASRTSCRWSAPVPGLLGSYSVTARVTDRSGNEANTGPTNMTVVNLGGTVEELTTNLLSDLGLLLRGLAG